MQPHPPVADDGGSIATGTATAGPMAAADELAMIRSQISALRAREQVLRDALVAAPEAARYGRWSYAEVVTSTIRVFDHRLLPQAVRDDPCFWHERRVVSVQSLPMTAVSRADWAARAPARPGPGVLGPVRRARRPEGVRTESNAAQGEVPRPVHM